MEEAPRSSNTSLQLDQAVNFSWENLTYRVHVRNEITGEMEWKTLLYNASGTAVGGRVLAIMGPSGAGKTTLVNGITGQLPTDHQHVLEGCCFLNDTVFTERYKKLFSIVAQDDIVMGKETPRDALRFASRVRLGLSVRESEERAEEVLTRLHLQGCADTLLGVPGLIKGVSGGEKKRTNIGSELITNPYIMLLDEPTTGLDSVNALRVGELLHELAHHERRTVLCTIHSPSSELFAVFDDLLLLAKGHVIYHGPNALAPAHFASIGYRVPPRTNPCEFYMTILQLPEEELSRMWTAWEDYVGSPAANNNPCISAVQMNISTKERSLDTRVGMKGASRLIQFVELTKRSVRLIRRDPASTIGRSIHTIFFSLLLGLFFFHLTDTDHGVQDRAGVIFMLVVNSIFTSAMSGVAAFPPERAVFLQEQSSESYSPWIYFFSKTLAETPFQIFFPTLFSCIVYFMIGLYKDAGAFFIFLFLIILIQNLGYSFGLLTTSLFPSAEIAMAFVPMVMLPLMIVAGLFANTSRLDPYWLWLNYISFPRYGFIGVFLNEFTHIGSLPGPRFTSGADVITYYGFNNYTWYECAYAMVIYMIGLRFLAAGGLAYQSWRRQGRLNFESNLGKRVMSARALAQNKRHEPAASNHSA